MPKAVSNSIPLATATDLGSRCEVAGVASELLDFHPNEIEFGISPPTSMRLWETLKSQLGESH